MHKIKAIPALNDNYIWLIMHPENQTAVIVDPGEAAPVLAVLAELKLKLSGILVTHHHWDHTNGIAEIISNHPAPVYTPTKDKVTPSDRALVEGDEVEIPAIDASFRVLDIPGHTLGHIAFVGLSAVFCGDTLFTAGCGKLFEGTAEQMLTSLDKLSALAPSTQVYCGHEYTLANLTFAQRVEPDNQAIAARLKTTAQQRAAHQVTVPADLITECATNPFLRVDKPSVQQAISTHFDQKFANRFEFFAALRHWKNNFRA